MIKKPIKDFAVILRSEMGKEQAYTVAKGLGIPTFYVDSLDAIETYSLDEMQKVIDRAREINERSNTTGSS